jgi:membrane-associated phospholipid phosphatase
VAVATAQAILAIRYFGWRGAGVAVLTAGLALGAIYGGFHYAVDVIAGVGVGSLVTAAALLVNRVVRTAPVQANASAPT